jgi:RNA polymerase sigma-70 factor (ECF subfamily)
MTLLLTDRALLEAFRRGEAQAISRVYHEYVVQVAGLLKRGFSFMSGGQVVHFRGFQNAWDLECAVQDTFIAAFSKRARAAYDGVNPFGPYLLTIARNRVISQLRSERRELRRRARFETEGQAPAPVRTPEEQAIEKELEEVVLAFRESLEPGQRRFFDLRYTEDRNLLETARVLGVTRMRARTLDRKVRDRFVRFLRERGHLKGPTPGGGSTSALLLMVMRTTGGGP